VAELLPRPAAHTVHPSGALERWTNHSKELCLAHSQPHRSSRLSRPVIFLSSSDHDHMDILQYSLGLYFTTEVHRTEQESELTLGHILWPIWPISDPWPTWPMTYKLYDLRVMITDHRLHQQPTCSYTKFNVTKVKVKVKASHTRHWELGPELIPVYRQSACRWP